MSDSLAKQLSELALTIERGQGRSTITGAISEIERLRAEKSRILTVGNSLLKFAEADSKCQCRREWVCHRCQAIDAWKSVCGE